jgi:Rod binding domain-containing protein
VTPLATLLTPESMAASRGTTSATQSGNTAKLSAPELAKLRKAAGEFESMLLESLWKSMKETFADPEEEADPTLKNFDDWGIHAMAGAVGESGGLGIKNLILKYLEPGAVTGGRATGAQK